MITTLTGVDFCTISIITSLITPPLQLYPNY
jgi:hypothetical protein